MDIEEIKDIIQKEGGKIVIVENGKPAFMVMSYEDYKERSSEKKVPSEAPAVTAPVHNIKPPNLPIKPAEERREAPFVPTRVRVEREELTIEDLPL